MNLKKGHKVYIVCSNERRNNQPTLLKKEEGREFNKISSSGDRMGNFTVQADDLKTLREKHETAIKRVKALDENGVDLIRHDLVT